MTAALAVGDLVPKMTLLDPDGSEWTPPWTEGRTTILDFHRHLA